MTTNENGLLLFIPCFNCQDQIPRVLSRLATEDPSVVKKIIIVDNQSQDNTLQRAVASASKLTQFNIEVIQNSENYGLGGSHKVAISYALCRGYQWVVVFHGDDQGDFRDLTSALKTVKLNKVDCLLGARFDPKSRLPGYSLLRKWGNHFFNLLYSFVAGKKLLDLGSGLNMYRTEIFRNGFIDNLPDDLTFNYGVLLRSIALRHRIKFFPIQWCETDQVSNVRLIGQTANVCKILLLYLISPKAFLHREMRSLPRSDYTYASIWENSKQNDNEPSGKLKDEL